MSRTRQKAVELRLRFFEREAENEHTEMWRASERWYDMNHAAEHRGAWPEFYRRQAAMQERIAAENRAKLNARIDGATKGGR